VKAGNTAQVIIAAGLLLTVAAREIHMVVTGGSGAGSKGTRRRLIINRSA
jgi:hypothetical protein